MIAASPIPNKRNPFRVLIDNGLISAAILFATATSLSAQTWTGNGADDFWFNSANWSTATVPNSFSANAIVDGPSPAILNGNVLLNSLVIGPNGQVTVNPGFFIALGTSATSPLVNDGLLTLLDGASLGLHNTVVNSGQIVVQAGANVTTLGNIVGSPVLTGGGTITLSGANARIFDQQTGTPVLTIADQTIEGEGSIGLNSFFIVNQAMGIIDANSTGNTLTIDSAGTNQGIFQASNGGILAIASGSYTNTGGIIQALNGSEVHLSAGVQILGGTLSTSGDGVVRVTDSNFNNALSGVTLNGNLELDDGSQLRIDGTIVNTGTMTINAGTNLTTLRLSGNTTLDGGGTIQLVGANARFIDDQPGQPVVTVANQTIEGSGLVGADFFLVNQSTGLINANSSGNVLTVAVSVFGTSQNQGILQASNGGILALPGAGDINNAGGTIQALNGSEVRISNGMGIAGGTISTSGNGLIRVSDNDFNNVLSNITLQGNFEVSDGSALRLLDVINNTGNFRINSGTNVTNVRISNNVTLTGGGTIRLANANARIFDDQPGTPVLTIANQTIEGHGFLGLDGIGIINQSLGVIQANSTGNTLSVDPAGFNMVNDGILRASAGGVLEVQANVFGLGTIDVGSGSLVDINGSTTANLIRGGGILEANDFVTGATFAPGDSVGTLNINTMNLGAGINIGNLEIELASASAYDLLALSMNSGTSSINGQLSIDLLGSFLPESHDVFTILTGLSLVPGFQQFSNALDGSLLLTQGGEGTFLVSYINGEVRLSNFVASIPEPALGAFCACVGILLLGVRRRRS